MLSKGAITLGEFMPSSWAIGIEIYKHIDELIKRINEYPLAKNKVFIESDAFIEYDNFIKKMGYNT